MMFVCDVETLNDLYSEVRDVLCPTVKLVK